MFLNEEVLRKYDACGEGIDFFNKHFPNGAELIDVVRYEKTPMAILHWGYTSLPTTDEEKAVYIERCQNENSEIVSLSHKVRNSKVVSKSSHVEDSEFIYRSQQVRTSKGIIDSRRVTQSEKVQGSRSVKKSHRIVSSKDVKESTLIYNSEHIFGCTNILNSELLEDCHFTNGCKESTDLYFCSQVENSKFCLFCHGIENAEYMIFNHSVSPKVYESFQSEVLEFMRDYQLALRFYHFWDYTMVTNPSPEIDINLTHYYKDFPEEFWDWVKELPHYEDFMAYQITYCPELLR